MIYAKTHHRLIQPERMFPQEAVKKSGYEDHSIRSPVVRIRTLHSSYFIALNNLH